VLVIHMTWFKGVGAFALYIDTECAHQVFGEMSVRI
jgi:hypothetical protein